MKVPRLRSKSERSAQAHKAGPGVVAPHRALLGVVAWPPRRGLYHHIRLASTLAGCRPGRPHLAWAPSHSPRTCRQLFTWYKQKDNFGKKTFRPVLNILLEGLCGESPSTDPMAAEATGEMNEASPRSCRVCPPSPIPSGPARAQTPPEDYKRRWSKECPSVADMEWELMGARSFEVAMLLRGEMSCEADLEHTRNEAASLLHVIDGLVRHSDVLAVLQTRSSSEPFNAHEDAQDHAALCLGLARLRQFLKLKIADTEDLRCADKALAEMTDFFEALDDLFCQLNGSESESSLFDLFLRLKNGL
jgi:hypothetical protein